MLTHFHYFAPISWYWFYKDKPNILIAKNEKYRRGSTCKKMKLASVHGQLDVSVPLKGGRNVTGLISEIEISYEEDWRIKHFKTLKSIYNNSPFFEFYEVEVHNFYKQKFENLYELNYNSHLLISKLLKLDKKIEIVEFVDWEKDDTRPFTSLEYLSHLKAPQFPVYNQVFMDKQAFVPNCSILDYLFCVGPKGL